MKNAICVQILLFLSLSAHASFIGEVSFSSEEIKIHQRNIKKIVKVAEKCLEDTWENHVQFYRKYGVTKYFGERNTSLNTIAKRRAVLASYGLSENIIAEIIPQQEPTSCVGLARKCLREGFEKIGEISTNTWNKIDEFAIINGVSGPALLDGLQKLGWKIYYWNPAPEMNEVWDAEDQRINPTNSQSYWGYHAWRFYTVNNRGNYYFNKVDDATSLVGFGNTTPKILKRSPLFVGIAHGGYHVFPGSSGKVIEGHSTQALNSFKNLEFGPFNPLAPGGAPRWTNQIPYRSGLIALPPL
jgi:hypothetical protein